jgi:hypothetical protein
MNFQKFQFLDWQEHFHLKPGVNFSNILCAAFTLLKAPNDTADLTVFFALLGSMCIKAVSRMLMTLSPGRIKTWSTLVQWFSTLKARRTTKD